MPRAPLYPPTYLVARADRILRGRLAQELSPFDVTIAELTTLSVLTSRPGLTNAGLARRALVSPQAMHKVVAGLERRGLVERVSGGGRLLSARISERGSALLVDVEKVRRRVENDFLEPLDPADKPEFVRMLTQLCSNPPEQDDDNTSQP